MSSGTREKAEWLRKNPDIRGGSLETQVHYDNLRSGNHSLSPAEQSKLARERAIKKGWIKE